MSAYLYLTDGEVASLKGHMLNEGFDTSTTHNLQDYLLWKAGIIDVCPQRARGLIG